MSSFATMPDAGRRLGDVTRKWERALRAGNDMPDENYTWTVNADSGESDLDEDTTTSWADDAEAEAEWQTPKHRTLPSTAVHSSPQLTVQNSYDALESSDSDEDLWDPQAVMSTNVVDSWINFDDDSESPRSVLPHSDN